MKSSCLLSALLLISCGTDALFVDKGSEDADLRSLGSLEQPIIYVPGAFSCNTTYRNKINAAEVYALYVIKSAVVFASQNNGLYSRWFGIWNSTRAATVQDVFADVLANWEDFEVDCADATCQANPTYGGYANSDPDLFHLCALWLAFPSGISTISETQPGIIDHEKVHVVSSVTDEDDGVCSVQGCYGAENAMALANENAAKAVNSADNYRFFAMEAYVVGTVLPSISILRL